MTVFVTLFVAADIMTYFDELAPRAHFPGGPWLSIFTRHKEGHMAQERRHDMGEGGFCICPRCSERIAHQQGIPCQEEACPVCGAKMLREGSHHHDLLRKKRASKDERSE